MSNTTTTGTKQVTPAMVLLIATLGAFMGSFANSSVNVALPPLGKALGLGGLELNWVTTAFVLGSAAFLLPMGRLGDIFGRKKLYALGMAINAIGAILSSIAPGGAFLIAMRAFSGLGASMIAPTASTLVVAVYPPEQRGRVLGIIVSATYLGLSAGPFLGGFLTAYLGWRGLFLVHGVLAVLVLVLVGLFLKGEWQIAKGEPIDWQGTVIYALGLSALLIGFSALPGVRGIVLLVAGIAALVAFAYWERAHKHPLLDLGIFKGNRVFALSNLAALFSYGATFSVGFFLSLYLEVVRGMPPQEAGLVMMVQPLLMAIFSPLTGRLSDRVEPRFLASAGMLLTALGLGVLASIGVGSPLQLIVAALVSLGLGFALFSSPNTNAVMGAVEHRHLSVASATLSTMRVVGMSASMGIALVLFSLFLGNKAIGSETIQPFMSAFHLAFVISAILCVFGVFSSLARGRVTRA
ncbi:MAG: MFS transporter [Rectinemataceae bacterium]